MGPQRKVPRHDDSNSDEEVNYLNSQVLGFWANIQGFNQDIWFHDQGNQG